MKRYHCRVCGEDFDVEDGVEPVCPVCRQKGDALEEIPVRPAPVASDRNMMDRLTYGLFVLTGMTEGKDNGCIVNTAMQVTTSPNRIALTVNRSNYTEQILRETGEFNLCILSEDMPFAVIERFGFVSGREKDKFEGFSSYARAKNGLTYLTDFSNAYLSGKVIRSIDLGTHTLFLCDVTDGACLSDTPSLTYEYYRQNIKPAPSASPAAEGKTVYRCKVCGYEYVGEELPDDFICPLCKHGAEDFEKIN